MKVILWFFWLKWSFIFVFPSLSQLNTSQFRYINWCRTKVFKIDLDQNNFIWINCGYLQKWKSFSSHDWYFFSVEHQHVLVIFVQHKIAPTAKKPCHVIWSHQSRRNAFAECSLHVLDVVYMPLKHKMVLISRHNLPRNCWILLYWNKKIILIKNKNIQFNSCVIKILKVYKLCS